MAVVLIRQFDLFRHEGDRGRRPFLLVLQADAVYDTRSVVVASLARRRDALRSRLNPEFVVEDEPHILLIADLAAVPRSALKDVVGNLGSGRDRIVTALDLLFFGF